ncbi:alpha/beta hydrolase [Shewanella sp.]|uniref:alpha/beta hydrolase n=1 Tax=Shewanella sp. TaxID=50422 RepID=UPI003A972903
MDLRHLSVKPLLVAITMAVSAAAVADTETSAPPSEADVRWQTLSPVANLYLDNAPASEFMAQGDEEKSRWNNYAGALAYYLMATERDPYSSWAPYQAAAALAYLRVPDQADTYLQLADQRGFWQYITMEEDDELAEITESSAYNTLLTNAKLRYPQHAQDVGKAYIHLPKGTAPADGWPVLVWLAGYGTEGSDSKDLAEVLTADKAIFIGINGTEKLDDHRFRWARTDTESTQQAVQQALALAAKSAKLDKKRVALMGFSQGALHSAHLLAEHPDDYCGALIVSAGGMQTAMTAAAPKGKRVVLSYGEAEREGNQALDKKLASYFSKDNQFEQHTHKGGHFFDADWPAKFPKYVEQVLGL